MKLLFLISTLAIIHGCSLEGKAKAQSAVEKTSDPLTLSCTANHQPNGPGTDVQTVDLAIASVSAESVELSKELEGYKFKVTWNKSLTTLYMTILKGDAQLVFSTSRVPTEDHNDAMVDIRLLGMPRLYLSCDFVEYRP